MKTVYKYYLPLDDKATVEMPKGAEVLYVGQIENSPYIWALVDIAAPVEDRVFYWRGTGHPADGLGKYVGSVIFPGNYIVFHLFEA